MIEVKYQSQSLSKELVISELEMIISTLKNNDKCKNDEDAHVSISFANGSMFVVRTAERIEWGDK